MLRAHCTKSREMLVAGVILLAVSGCSSAEPQATFTGTVCEYTGPDTLQAGGVEVTFENSSGEFAALAFLELPDDESVRERELALIGSDAPIPDVPDPEGAQLAGFLLAEPGEKVVEEAPLPTGEYVIDCATFDGDQPSHAWRAAAIEVEG